KFVTLRWCNFALRKALRNLDQSGMLSACGASDDVRLYAGSVAAENVSRTTPCGTAAGTNHNAIPSACQRTARARSYPATIAGGERQDGMGKRVRRPVDCRVGRRVV